MSVNPLDVRNFVAAAQERTKRDSEQIASLSKTAAARETALGAWQRCAAACADALHENSYSSAAEYAQHKVAFAESPSLLAQVVRELAEHNHQLRATLAAQPTPKTASPLGRGIPDGPRESAPSVNSADATLSRLVSEIRSRG